LFVWLKTVRIKPDPSVSGAAVQVDVVALNSSNQGVADYPVSKYWLPGDAMRSSAIKKIQFDSTGLQTQTVSIPSGTQSVAIIADLPGLFNDAPGSGDPRRKIIPATGKGVASEVDVAVSRSSIRVLAPNP
jgi:hypothetical protein